MQLHAVTTMGAVDRYILHVGSFIIYVMIAMGTVGHYFLYVVRAMWNWLLHSPRCEG